MCSMGVDSRRPRDGLNFDASPTLRVQRLPLAGFLRVPGGPVFPANVRYGDIVKGLPVEATSCRAVYCSHVLEHLSLSDFRLALANTKAVLAEGGRLPPGGSRPASGRSALRRRPQRLGRITFYDRNFFLA